jgi:hypothetical protein
MSAQDPSASQPAKKWREMRVWEKLVFIGKAFVFVLTGGFAYPNLFSDD